MRLTQVETKINQVSDLILHIKTRFILGVILLFAILPLLYFFAVSTQYSFDLALLVSVTSVSSPWLDLFFLYITELGGYLLIPLAILLVLWLLSKRRYLYAGFFVIGGVNAYFLKVFLKLIYQRDRPTIFESLLFEEHFSYPSGHAFASALFWGFVAWILLQQVRSPIIRAIIIGATILIIILVGISRVYLGLHWPSDVLAGWLLGAWWLYFVLGFFHDFGLLKK
jgi:undecaprenyl-diphosphatase